MASIVKKIIRGRPYYYARVCKRVGGKPKIVSQTYLGRSDKILEKLRAAPAPAQPLEAVVREFGASAALPALARRLRLVEHIARHLPKRGSGPSVGTYLLAADLASRYRKIAAGTETITLVFDKGNHSRENLDWIERSPFHFIGSLVPTQHRHLLDVSVDRMQSLEADGLPRVRAYRTECKVFGVPRTVLVTWNQSLFDAQCRTLLREIEKRRQHLGALQRQLWRWRDSKIWGGAAGDASRV